MPHYVQGVVQRLGHDVEFFQRMIAVRGLIHASRRGGQQLIDGRLDVRGLHLIEGHAELRI